MIPNMSPKIFSLSAVVVGYILIDDMTANEQNAVGNWLMLVAQVLCTNAFYRQVMQERGVEKKNSSESGKTFGPDETLVMLDKIVKAIRSEMENIKKEV
ncbi:MAG: hypothetical protein Q4C29_01060 [bacterium]|nr:hypothetical protein [bacterium]